MTDERDRFWDLSDLIPKKKKLEDKMAKKQEELLRFVADEEKEAEKDNERLSGERSSWQAQVNGAAAQASLGPAVKKAVLGFVLAAVLKTPSVVSRLTSFPSAHTSSILLYLMRVRKKTEKGLY